MREMKIKDRNPRQHEVQLIRVDGDDTILGYCEKGRCHARNGLLHRAFSVFIFNDEKKLLLQRRSKEKLLWPLYWSNSVCSHPRKGENYETAAARRVKEELGIECGLHFLFKFQYQVNFEDIGAEHELCAVFIGRTNSPVFINKEEIAEIKYLSIDAVEEELKVNSAQYSPWFKIEWGRIRKGYLPNIDGLFDASPSSPPRPAGSNRPD